MTDTDRLKQHHDIQKRVKTMCGLLVRIDESSAKFAADGEVFDAALCRYLMEDATELVYLIGQANAVRGPDGPEACDHGISEGDWCEECNKDYKAAAADPDNGNGEVSMSDGYGTGERLRNYLANTGRTECEWQGCSEPPTVLVDAGSVNGRCCVCRQHGQSRGVIVLDELQQAGTPEFVTCECGYQNETRWKCCTKCGRPQDSQSRDSEGD